ncbi:MAG: DUF2141 domain-containing protein, partial [Myxococcota bacterium]
SGAVDVNEYSQTGVPSVYAIGDVTNRVNLTPVAIREGMAFVETVFKGNPTPVDHELIPTAIFTQPEFGTVGLSEEEASAQEPAPTGVVITIVNLKSDSGPVNCTLFRSAEGFPTEPDRALRRVQVRARGQRAQCLFPVLAPGRYAVAVWHDEDGDGELDTNFLGVPQERIGASNNAQGTFGPPRFRDAAFRVQGVVRQTVRVE